MDAVALAVLGIEEGEGCELHAYPDPVTKAEPFTIGYGCTGPDIGPDTVWTQDKADIERDKRLQQLVAQFDHVKPWWRRLSPERAAVLLELAYNLGFAGLLTFRRMLSACECGAFKVAADELSGTPWERQVGLRRAGRLEGQLRTGVCPLVHEDTTSDPTHREPAAPAR